MLANCDAIVAFPIYRQFGAIWKPDSNFGDFRYLLSGTLFEIYISLKFYPDQHQPQCPYVLSKRCILLRKVFRLK